MMLNSELFSNTSMFFSFEKLESVTSIGIVIKLLQLNTFSLTYGWFLFHFRFKWWRQNEENIFFGEIFSEHGHTTIRKEESV